MTEASSRARSFDRAAAQYAASRPSYPPAVLDAVEELLGRPLAGARVADVGAGTGLATALLRERGASVIGVEPGDGMTAEFRQALPDVPVVRGDGNALPLADACLDLITYAQSWQWTDTGRSVPQALRVLRPGGALAIWWNTTASDVPWIVAQAERVARHCGSAAPRSRPGDAEAFRLAGLDRLPVTRRALRWSRDVPLDPPRQPHQPLGVPRPGRGARGRLPGGGGGTATGTVPRRNRPRDLRRRPLRRPEPLISCVAQTRPRAPPAANNQPAASCTCRPPAYQWTPARISLICPPRSVPHPARGRRSAPQSRAFRTSPHLPHMAPPDRKGK